MMGEKPNRFVDADWLLVVEALVEWAGPPSEDMSDREVRAYQLAEGVGRELGLSLDEMADELELDHDQLTPVWDTPHQRPD